MILQPTRGAAVRRRSGDPQKDRVYDAEAAAGCHDSRRFEDFKELADWIVACLSTCLIEQDYPSIATYVREGRAPGNIIIRQRQYRKPKTGFATIAHATASELAFTKQAWCTWMVCHELAHLVAVRHYGAASSGHGWQFCEVYLKLVGWFIGYKERDMLRAEFDKRGILHSHEQAVPRWLSRRVGMG